MKLIIRTATFECLGEMLSFDVTVIIDEAAGHNDFTFKPAPELCIKYGMPEIGFPVEANAKNEIIAMQLLLPNPVLAAELGDCIRNYIKDFSHKSI